MGDPETEVLVLAQRQQQARRLAEELSERPFAAGTRRAVEEWLAGAAEAERVWARLQALPVERVHTLAARVLGGGGAA